ncbi:hypothetical protein GE061_000192 [Apolygus lucorum]|uniref:Regulatory protein zeste n=1 Tax=Apolygus lucorum TaxID=248454 RepID=A0A8S9Y3P0_APOLU|nr:hypothetical protein GE061_000192 [Apolygus lucorum]
MHFRSSRFSKNHPRSFPVDGTRGPYNEIRIRIRGRNVRTLDGLRRVLEEVVEEAEKIGDGTPQVVSIVTPRRSRRGESTPIRRRRLNTVRGQRSGGKTLSAFEATTEALVPEVNTPTITGPRSDVETPAFAWALIEEKFNSTGKGPYRDAKALKMKYEGVKKELRKKDNDWKVTGGGPSTYHHPTIPEEEIILGIQLPSPFVVCSLKEATTT